MMRKSGELLKCGRNTGICKYGFCGFLLRKNGCSGSVTGLLQPFAVTVYAGFIPRDLLIAGTVTAREPIEYCLSVRYGDPVRIRNNRPLLYLAFAISQRACYADWVYHALTGECNHVCPYLRADGLHFFCLRENHITVREGCK